MTYMRRLGKCLCQPCGASMKLVSVFLCPAEMQRSTVPRMIPVYSRMLPGLEWYQAAGHCDQLLHLKFLFFSGMMRSVSLGNSDLQSRNISSNEHPEQSYQTHGLAACCTWMPI